MSIPFHDVIETTYSIIIVTTNELTELSLNTLTSWTFYVIILSNNFNSNLSVSYLMSSITFLFDKKGNTFVISLNFTF